MPTTEPGINFPLLAKIARVIQNYPAQFSINSWHSVGDEAFITTADYVGDAPVTACGTTHCIAGWAEVLAREEGNTFKDDFARTIGREELGLTWDQAERLFYAYNWPDVFRGQPVHSLFTTEYRPTAEQAVQRILHFIATNGDE